MEDSHQAVELTCSGDCAAGHAGWALMNPVWRAAGGNKCCFRCTAQGKDWIDEEACKLAWPRNFVYQCVANHVNPYPFLPGHDSSGKLYSLRPPPKCPHCHVTVNEALMAKEAAEWEAAPNKSARTKIENDHAAKHAGAHRGRRGVLPMDNRKRSRGLLHRRMNIASNCLMATFLKVKFCESHRIAANALLHLHKMIYRFPETPGKRAKSISAGNDSRRLFSNSMLLVGLIKIFYPAQAAEHEAALNALAAAADANADVRTEETAAPAAAPAPAATAKPGPSGGVQKKPRQPKKKTVAVVLAPGGARIDAAAVKEYTAKRKAAEKDVAGDAPAPAPAPGAEAEHTPADEDKEGDKGDASLEPEEDEMEDMLDEDETAGGLQTAIEVWLTAIRYTAALHATVDDPFDDEQVRAYATKCAFTGKKWAVKINEHTSNKALWQYVHDAFCHIEEDILVNGPLDRNDDSILEKGNRRKKRLGDRCTFRGGKNGNPASGRATFTQVRRVKVRDANGTFTGNYLRKTITRLANIGVAAQVLKLDLIAQLCEAQRACASARKSPEQMAFEVEQKAVRQEKREATENAMVQYELKVHAPNFHSGKATALSVEEKKAVIELEKMNMQGFARNGDAFETYLNQPELTVHTATSADGELYGFAVSGAEPAKSKFFVYEVHVAKMARRCGIGSMLLSIVEKHTQHPKGKGKAVELELHVHEANEEARAFYVKQGFLETGKIASGMVIMRRKRDVPS